MLISGLRFSADYLDASREQKLLEAIDRLQWLTELSRRVQHHGWRYDYKARKVAPDMYLGPLPDWAQALAEELHERGLMPKVADQLIVNEYLPGQGIAPHVDCVTCFDDTIASLSLGSSCVMEFTLVKNPASKVPLFLPSRSLILLSGEARYQWRHGIPKRKSDTYEGGVVLRGRRVSLTFRNVLVERSIRTVAIEPRER